MIDRRRLLASTAAFAGAAGLARPAAAAFLPRPAAWREVEVTTRVVLASGAAQVWVPLPSVEAPEWVRPGSDSWVTDGRATIRTEPRYGARMLHVVFPAGTQEPAVTVTSRVATRDRAVDPGAGGSAVLTADERRLWLAPTDLIPTDGIVKATADRIVAGREGPVARARAVYDWVVENTVRDAATRGCGTGDVGSMLRTGFLGGKCADLNALFVGLLRAAGIPARDVYGIRVGPSRFGYASLGPATETITKAQHCRAEFFVDGAGWVPADPADVRKVVLEEGPGGLPLDHPKVAAARAALFGGAEGNWIPYNTAHDLRLDGAAGPPLGFLMYPEAELAGTRLDCLDPDGFRYGIRARDVTA